MTIIQNTYDWFLEALFPPKCLICKKEGAFLCLEHKELPEPTKINTKFKYLENIYVGTNFQDPTVHKIVEYFKFNGFRMLSNIIAKQIYKQLPNDFKKEGLLIPIPLYWTRGIWRGFNQSTLIAQSLQYYLPQMEISYDLKKIKSTKQQAKLLKLERQSNVKDIFIWKGGIVDKPVFLIDDITTTGATLDSACLSLRLYTKNNIQGIVFAGGGKLAK